MEAWKSKFYNSRQWKDIRKKIQLRDRGICQMCNKLVVGRLEVHHKIELTEQNYTDESVSLNPDLLISTCSQCHNNHHGRFTNTKQTIVGENWNIDYERR